MRPALRSSSLIFATLSVMGIHSWAQTTEDGFLPKVAGSVRCVAAMPSGKLWIGGDITQVNSTSFQNLACLQWDGVVAKTPVIDTNGAVLCLQPMADASLWVGGAFSEVAKQPRAGLARLREAGSAMLPDNEFSPEFDGEVRCLLADGDGVLVGGNFLRVNGLRRAGVARLFLNGEVDAAFDAKLEGEIGIAVNAMARQPDGKIVLGGLFDMAGQQAVTNVARIYSNGALDSRFLGSADGMVHALGIQATGNIVIGGDFLNVSGHVAAKLARLNRYGDFADTLEGFDERVSTIGIQPDGRVLVGGRFGPVPGAQHGGFVRLTSELRIEKSDPRVTGEVFCCMPQSDGRVLLGGSFTMADQKPSYGLARLDSNMKADASVGSRTGVTTGSITTAVQQPDERLLFTGPFSRFGGFSVPPLVRTDSNAVADTTFSYSGLGPGVTGLQVRRDQKLFAFGNLSGERPGIVRLQSTGAFDQSFTAYVHGTVSPLAVNAIADVMDEQLLLGGNFTHINQSSRPLIGQVTGNGAISQGSLPVLGGVPSDFLTSPTGELTVAGILPAEGQTPARRFVRRYNSKGTLVTSFPTESGGKFNGMCRLPDGRVLIWGLQPLGVEGNLVRLSSSGAIDYSFSPGFNGEVTSVSVQADGSMLVLGAFNTFRYGSAPDGFVHLGTDLRNRNTTVVASISPPGTGRGGLVQADGKFLFWGGFSAAKGSRPGLARLSSVVPASQELGFVDGEGSGYPRIGWKRSGSAPQVERVWFSSSTNGSTYGPASEGRWVNGRWEWEKYSLPARTPVWVRAEGRVPSPGGGDSGGLVQSIRQIFLEGEIDVTLDERSLVSGEEDEIDFGGQIQGVSPVGRTFTVTNRGNHGLTLRAPIVPEGFVAYVTTDMYLAPGDHTVIEVFSDLSHAGSWTGELVIPSDDIDEGEFVIPLKSQSLTPLRTTLVKPRAVLNRKTGLHEQTIHVRNAAGITYAGYRVIVSGLPQGVELRNASEQLPDGSYVIEVPEALGPFAHVDLKLEYSFPKKKPVKLIPRITTEVILVPTAE